MPTEQLSTLEFTDETNTGIETALSSNVTSSMLIYFYVRVTFDIPDVVSSSKIAKFEVDVKACEIVKLDSLWSTEEDLVIQIG